MNFVACSAYAFWRASVQYSDRILKLPYWIPEIKETWNKETIPSPPPPKKDERRLIRRAASGYQVL